MKTMRDAFGESLVELGKLRNDFVVLDADVAGGTGAQPFREAFPDRFIQCAIAEPGAFRRGAIFAFFAKNREPSESPAG